MRRLTILLLAASLLGCATTKQPSTEPSRGDRLRYEECRDDAPRACEPYLWARGVDTQELYWDCLDRAEDKCACRHLGECD